MRDALADFLDGFGRAQFLNVKVANFLNVMSKLLISFIVPMVKRTAIEANDTGEAAVVVDGGSSSNLGAETVTANGSICYFVLIHEPYNIV